MAVKFVSLTAVRSKEATAATWSEIDLEAAVWVIPSSRTKTGRELRVPLSHAALAVLAAARCLGNSDVVFPSPSSGNVLDTKRLREVLAAAGLSDTMTIHGLRSTFRDWAGESGQDREVAEAALGHVVGGTEGSYFRSDLFERRRQLMAAWALYLGAGVGGKVVQLRA